MPRPPSQNPTELELEILKVLWRIGPATVRMVREELAGFRALAHTSVMTVMTIMTQKGYLTRRKKRGGYVYRTRISEKAAKAGLASDLLERAFQGSAVDLMLNLLEEEKVDPEELNQLRNLIERKAKEKQR